jgi:hypothetical protein
MDQVQIIILFRKYIANDCSTEEIKVLFNALRDIKNKSLFQKLIEEHWQEASEQQKDALYGEQMRLAFDNTDIRLRDLLENTSVSGRKTFSFRWTSYAAACIVLLVGIFIYFNSSNDPLDPFGENYKHQSTLTLGHNETL